MTETARIMVDDASGLSESKIASYNVNSNTGMAYIGLGIAAVVAFITYAV